MKVLKLSLLALGMSLSGLAQADVIGVKGDLSYWAYDGQANMAAQTAARRRVTARVLLESGGKILGVVS